MIAAGIILANSCKDDESDDTSLTGIWYSAGGASDYSLELNADKSYELVSYGFTLERGNFTSSGNLVLTSTSSSVCPSSDSVATYNYSISGNTLDLTEVDDDCPFRSGVLALTFTK